MNNCASRNCHSLQTDTVLFRQNSNLNLLTAIWLSSPLPDAETSLARFNFIKAFQPKGVVGTDGMEFKPVTFGFTDGRKKLVFESSRLTLTNMRHRKNLRQRNNIFLVFIHRLKQ